MRSALLIAFHFPPVGYSSGVHRTLKLVQHMPAAGWRPLVVAPHPRAYPLTSRESLEAIPKEAVVERVFALDAVRHLGYRNRYLGWTALPDRWITWFPFAVRAAKRLCRIYKPDVIWSTFPIATAHLVARTVHRATGIPWLADFRDPMTMQGHPADERQRRAYAAIERTVFRECNSTTFTTRGALGMYRERFPELDHRRSYVIGNGYDEEDFVNAIAEIGVPEPTPLIGRKLQLLHSGYIYPRERDPSALFEALRMLKATGEVSADNFELMLRASSHEELLTRLAGEHGVDDLVRLGAPLEHKAALCEMLSADGLVLLQARNCNAQIPAKAYEYLRAGQPIIGLTDPAGDTAALLRDAGSERLAELDNVGEIQAVLRSFLDGIRNGSEPRPRAEETVRHSRLAMSTKFINVFDELASTGGAAP